MRIIFRAFFFTMIISSFLIRPASSYADWQNNNGSGQSQNSGQSHYSGQSQNSGQSHYSGQNQNSGQNHGDWHGHDGGHGYSYVGVGFSAWPDNYYYGAPYYPPADDGLVSAPVYQPVVINGTTYYLNDGTYYVYNGYGYQAVAPPDTVIQPPPVVGPAPAITAPGTPGDPTDAITINIPNNKGGYTAVTLKRSGNGFIGPQGEFYPTFPTVNQLEVIYGKNS